MSLLSLPCECFSNIIFFLDEKSLYKCLFVNRYSCKFSIPMIWREPFRETKMNPKISLVISTLLACLNEDEIFLLIPCAINLQENNQPSLFEYGKFVRIIEHKYLVENIIVWLKSSSGRVPNVDDCRIRGLINVIYHMIMRQGSNLQEFSLGVSKDNYYIDLPKLSTLMTYKPGITNLRSLIVDCDMEYDAFDDNMKCQNAIGFLNMVPIICDSIVSCDLWIDKLNITYIKLFLDIIKSQPLESMFMSIDDNVGKVVKGILDALEFRSETLKELIFYGLDIHGIDFSIITKLECLERLEFRDCNGFTFKNHETLIKKKLHLKELGLWANIPWYSINYYTNLKFDSVGIDLNVIEEMINSLCSEMLVKLSLNIVTLETIKAVKECCSNISFLHINIYQNQFLDSIILIICELPLLKTLIIDNFYRIYASSIVKILGDCLTSIEYLSLNFYVDLSSFEYFTNNCKANLKKLNVIVNNSLKDYLQCVDNFQKMHNSLKVLGIGCYSWTNEELNIVNSLTNQGVDIILTSYE